MESKSPETDAIPAIASNPASGDATLAELEGTYWQSVGICPDLRYRVLGGKAQFCSIDGGGWVDTNAAALQDHIERNKSTPWFGAVRMTPAEVAATWPELAEPAPYPWADGVDLTGGLVEVIMPDGEWYSGGIVTETRDDGEAVIRFPAHAGLAENVHPSRFIRPALPPGGWQAGMRARVVSDVHYLKRHVISPPVGIEVLLIEWHEGSGTWESKDEKTGKSWGCDPADLLYLPEPAPTATPEPATRDEAAKRQERRYEQAEQTRRDRAAENEQPTKKRGKWRKLAEAARAEVDTLRGERDAARGLLINLTHISGAAIMALKQCGATNTATEMAEIAKGVRRIFPLHGVVSPPDTPPVQEYREGYRDVRLIVDGKEVMRLHATQIEVHNEWRAGQPGWQQEGGCYCGDVPVPASTGPCPVCHAATEGSDGQR